MQANLLLARKPIACMRASQIGVNPVRFSTISGANPPPICSGRLRFLVRIHGEPPAKSTANQVRCLGEPVRQTCSHSPGRAMLVLLGFPPTGLYAATEGDDHADRASGGSRDAARADAELIDRAAAWLRDDIRRDPAGSPGSGRTGSGTPWPTCFDALADDVADLDEAVRWQARKSCRVLLGGPMASPDVPADAAAVSAAPRGDRVCCDGPRRPASGSGGGCTGRSAATSSCVTLGRPSAGVAPALASRRVATCSLSTRQAGQDAPRGRSVGTQLARERWGTSRDPGHKGRVGANTAGS
jgi:hypothetical protein